MPEALQGQAPCGQENECERSLSDNESGADALSMCAFTASAAAAFVQIEGNGCLRRNTEARQTPNRTAGYDHRANGEVERSKINPSLLKARYGSRSQSKYA